MSAGNRDPEMFDPGVDEGEPMRVYAITPEDEAMVDRLCRALTDALMNDSEFASWLSDRDRETIEAMDMEVM